MHLPDGFLDAKTMITTGVLSAGGIATAVRQFGRRPDARKVPLIGLTAAFIFVAQLINFPVAAGTSGHLIGATLAVVLLGPNAAIIVMSCVLLVQAFVFADGGVFVLGANILNMAIVAPIAAVAVYRVARKVLRGRRGQLIASALAAWTATVAAALFCAGELAWSGTAPWSTVFPAMTAVHVLIGAGEAAITMLVLAAIMSGRPELVPESDSSLVPSGRAAMFVYAALLAIGALILLVPHASSLPDGLERISESLGFARSSADSSAIAAPLSGYRVSWLGSSDLSVIAAAAVGAVVVFAGAWLLARILVPRGPAAGDPAPPERT